MRATEDYPSTLPQPQLSKQSFVDKLNSFFDSTRQLTTCTCTKVTWRFIQLCISLWQIGDMVSDAFQTRKFYHLAMVRKNNTTLQYFETQLLTMPTVHPRGQRIKLLI